MCLLAASPTVHAPASPLRGIRCLQVLTNFEHVFLPKPTHNKGDRGNGEGAVPLRRGHATASSFSGDVRSHADPDDRVVLFFADLRREIARGLLREFAGRLEVDRVRLRTRRSRAERARSGVGALLGVSSDVAWRPTPLISLFYFVQPGTRSRLRYGISELGSAVAPPAALKRHRAFVLAAPILAALAATAVHARRLRAEHEAQPASPSPEEAPVASRV
jgi:hypothetical protein